MSACEYCTARTGHREGCTETLPGEPTLDDMTPAEQRAALTALAPDELLEQALESLADAAMWRARYSQLLVEHARQSATADRLTGDLAAARETAAEWRARESLSREAFDRLYAKYTHALMVPA